MRDLASIESSLAALQAALGRSRHDAAVGHGARDLARIFAEHEEATHPDTEAAIGAEVLAEEGAPRAGRLLDLCRSLSVQRAQAGLETQARTWEQTAKAGDLSLREVQARLRSEPSVGLRRKLAEACLVAERDGAGIRADRIERTREAQAKLPASDAPGGLIAQAEEELKRTADAYTEVLTWAARKYVEDAPPPDGELAAPDVLWLAAGQAEGGAFPAGAVRLTAGAVLEAMGLPLKGRGVRLDLERRPGKAVGAHAAWIADGVVAAAALPTGSPMDLADALEALGRATLLAAGPPPGFDETLPRAMGLLLGRVILEPQFHLRVLGATAAEASRSIRLLALGELLAVRQSCARLLGEEEIAASGTGRSRLRAFASLLSDARRAVTDEREVLGLVGLPGDAAGSLAARSLAGLLADQLTLRFDEDWFRNPRSGPFLQELLDPGRTALEVAGQLGGSIDIARASARPLYLLDRL